MFSLQQTQRTRGQNRGGRRELFQTVYTHVSKCKNNKIKKELL
jgi:hypothetical protein